jgi:hypothetical protein
MPTSRVVRLVVRRAEVLGPRRVLVSNAVPLEPGALGPGQLRWLRVEVRGLPQAAWVRPLAALHPDGSLRSVLVQFVVDFGADSALPGRLMIGEEASAPPAGPPPPAAPVPEAAALPVDPEYLIRTRVAGGPTASVERARGWGPVYRRYDVDFRAFADTHWHRVGPAWNDGNYYDRALVYYAAWARSGDPTYWWRAARQAVTYRAGYIESSGYTSSPHWSQIEGLEQHYVLTGDERSRLAALRTADNFLDYLPQYFGGPETEPRIVARFLLADLVAWRLTPSAAQYRGSVAAGTPLPPTPPLKGGRYRDEASWRSALARQIAQTAAWQSTDGAWRSTQVCGGQLNYMAALLGDALVKVHEEFRPGGAAPDQRLGAMVARSVGFLRTQWRAPFKGVGSDGRGNPVGGFVYSSVACPGVGAPVVAPDLTGLFVTPVGWSARQRGAAPTLRYFAEDVFAASVSGAYLDGGKQFNQQYATSFRYLGYR